MKTVNKKAVETKVVAELILGLILTVILIDLIYYSFRDNDTVGDACFESLVLARRLNDLSVINCPYHKVNISSKELASAVLSREIVSCWFRFGHGDVILSDNSDDVTVFCYVCSLVKNSEEQSYVLTLENVTNFLENFFVESNDVSGSFDKNNLKMKDSILLHNGDTLYVFFAINKTLKGDFFPYIGVTKEDIMSKCKIEINSLR